MQSGLRRKIREWLLRHPLVNPYRTNFSEFFRYITSQIRLQPSFIIIGYPKCGTTSLYDYLIQHPNIGSASRKELDFFNLAYKRGIQYYKSHFPTTFSKKSFENKFNSKFITGEATPLYISHPYALSRIRKHFPDIKLILLLRNPIDRAFSHYQHQRRGNLDKITKFEEVINLDKERHKVINEKYENNEITHENQGLFMQGYIEMGKYINDIERLYDLFDKKQILILFTDELNHKRDYVLKTVFEFLGIPEINIPDTTHKNVGNYQDMDIKTRELLIKFYEPYNKKLEDFLDLKLDWNK
tara:strand:+ start:14113 stop:15009 length:897 start_codon:yes stop_codon:yes gene_type:complete